MRPGGFTKPGSPAQRITIIGDEPPLFQEVLLRALGRSRFIIITGGLGATDDDLTAPAAAEALGLPLRHDEALLARLHRYLEKRQIPWLERYGRLALIPQGAVVLDPGGMACGFTLKHGDVQLFFLPGVPTEMRAMFDAYVLPRLLELAGDVGAWPSAPCGCSASPKPSCRRWFPASRSSSRAWAWVITPIFRRTTSP